MSYGNEQKLKVLIVSNLYPMRDRPQGGSFILSRLKLLPRFSVDYKLVMPFYNDLAPIRLLKRLIRSPNFEPLDLEKSLKIGVNRDLTKVVSTKLFDDYIDLCQVVADRILELVSCEEFHLIHAHGAFKDLPAAEIARLISEKTGKPYIVTLHGDDVNSVMKSRRIRYVDTFQKAAAVIFVSNALFENAKKQGFSSQRTFIIPNGFDPTVFKPLPKHEVRKELQLYEDGAKYVGFVGSLDYVKGADRLPLIFREIAKEIPKVRFLIVGDGPFRRMIEKTTRGLDVLITGFVKQEVVSKFMNAMDVMVLPSRSEGYGAVCVEAQACGTIVLGSSNGGIPEAIGLSEYLVEDGFDFERRLANKVVQVLQSQREDNRIAERTKDLTWEQIVEKEVHVYRDVLMLW